MSIPDLIRIHSYRHRHRHIVPIIISIVCIALLIFYMTSVSNPHQQQDTMLRMKLGMKVKSSSSLKPLPVVVATRFWGHTLNDLETLHTFLVRTLDYAQHVIVAINTEKDTIDTPHALLRWDFPHVTTLPVTPWYGMSSALNALLLNAATHNYTYILYQSIEIKATREHIAVLLTELDDETICTGAYLAGAHQFQPGIHPVSGINIPWNTIALWHLPTLLRVGFLPVSDGLMPGSNARAGVEEMPVMALLQTIASQQEKMQTEINTPRATVKLIRMRDPVIWEADFEKDETRRAWQQQKIATKISRGAAHVRALGVRASFVFHIIQDTHGGRGDTSNPNHAHAEHPS